ncbi:MAG: zinc-binding dehydrogenase, partial [Planctomycetota bacterium]
RLCEKWGIKSRPLADITPRADQDVVVDCTGSREGMATAMQLLRPRGTLVLKSTVAPGGEAVDLSPLVVDEINLIGSRCGPFKPAIRALAEGHVDVHSMISRRVPMGDALEALRLAASPGVLKVLLTM